MIGVAPALHKYNGGLYTLKEIARMNNVKYSTLHNRLRLSGFKMSIAEALEYTARGPRKYPSPTYNYHGKYMTLQEIASITGISVVTIRNRIHAGWTIEEAADTPIRAKRDNKPRMQNDARAVNHIDGMNQTEIERYKAAVKICRTIVHNPYAFNFRCTLPAEEYRFEHNILGYIIRFNKNGTRARLSAYYRKHELMSDLNRAFMITGEAIREIQGTQETRGGASS